MLNAEEVLAGARSTVNFHPADLVRELVAYGEVEASENLMHLDAQAIAAIGVLASRHYSAPSHPMLDTAICMGIVEFLEEQARPLKRKRRIYPKAWKTTAEIAMLRVLAVPATVLLLLGAPCEAQTLPCGSGGIPLTVLGGAPFVAFVPSSPDASQAIAVSVGMVDYNPIGASAVVQGNAINITLTAIPNGFVPPLQCSATTLGPVASGNYIVNLFLAVPTLPTIQTATGALAVAPTPIPAMSSYGIVILILSLTVLLWWNSRRRIAVDGGTD